MIFGQYLDNYLKDLDETWSEVRQNGYKSVAKDSMVTFKPILKIFRPIDSKMDQNLWMIHKIFFIFFFIMFSISNQITVFIFFLGGPLKFMLVYFAHHIDI